MNAMTATPAFDAGATRLSAVLAQVATIVKVKTTALGLRRQDKQAAKESARDHNADEKAVSVNVLRLAGRGKDLADALVKKGKETQNDIAALTTAWEDDRLLPNDLYESCLKIYGQREKEYEAIRQEMIDLAPYLISEAEQRLGTYKVAPPTEQEIREAYSMQLTLRAIPDSSTYTTMDKQMEHVLRARFEADTQAAYQAAQRDAFTRLAKPLEHLVDRMAALEQSEKDKANNIGASSARIYASVITNVQDMCAVFETFNLTNDPAIQKIADKLNAFDGIEIDDLKRSEQLRSHTVAKAKEILAGLSDWL
jgi:hypothetical protein